MINLDNNLSFFKNVALTKGITGNHMRFIFLLLSCSNSYGLTQGEIIDLTGWKRQVVSKLSIDLVEMGLIIKNVKYNLNFYSVNYSYNNDLEG